MDEFAGCRAERRLSVEKVSPEEVMGVVHPLKVAQFQRMGWKGFCSGPAVS